MLNSHSQNHIDPKISFLFHTMYNSYNPSFMAYSHNSGGQLFCNLPAKIDDVIWWDLLVSNSFFKKFEYHFLDIIRRDNTFKDLKSTNKALYETYVLGSNFDKITIKLDYFNLPVALSCYTSCVGQMQKNLPSGQIIGNI
jgi:hypothetical protein